MLTRLFLIALLMGMTLGLTSNVAIADDKFKTSAVVVEKADQPVPPEWEDRGRSTLSRGVQPTLRRMRDGDRRRGGPPGRGPGGEFDRRGPERGGRGMGGPGMGRPGPGMGGPGTGPGMGGPGRGGSGMGRGMGRGRGFESMQKSDPEMYKLASMDHELERETMELSKRYRRAPREAKEDIKEQLEKVVGQHFEVRQHRRVLELNRIKKELDRLSEAIKRRIEARDDIIQRRIMRLTGEEDPLDF